MEHTPTTVEQLRELIHKGEVKDPLVYFESVMSGQDPRKQSELYQMVMEIEDFCNGGSPSVEDWNEVVNFVLKNFKYATVSLNESSQAAKELANYLHAKKKSTELSVSTNQASLATSPLEEEEVELFREKFNDEF